MKGSVAARCVVVGIAVTVLSLPLWAEDAAARGCCPGHKKAAAKGDVAKGTAAEKQVCSSKTAKGCGGGPGSLLRCAEVLKLTEEQKTKLAEIQKEAREKALAVLTAEQKKQLEACREKCKASGACGKGGGCGRGAASKTESGKGSTVKRERNR